MLLIVLDFIGKAIAECLDIWSKTYVVKSCIAKKCRFQVKTMDLGYYLIQRQGWLIPFSGNLQEIKLR